MLAVIPARGGSKGVPRKNIRAVAGKPLIAWTIEEAKRSRFIDRLVLSSEDPEIIAVAREWGCEVPFVRPSELSRDDTPGIAPVLHAIEALPGYDYVVLLQPTSPLRTAADIDACITLCVTGKSSTCVSVTEPDKSPYWMFTRDQEERLCPLMDNVELKARRQDLPTVFALNGAVYVGDCAALVRQRSFIVSDTVSYVMNRRSSIDIDSEMDLLISELFLLNPALGA
ncbi:acylneuraminate cytidylyltransferase family protein [Geomesophilobacter sediminis]|uniref:acylneuraminate cytidylyltransferase family protein n=1 Tax=Geomesophilobacter sediminis TaxID=2798584 RepID=UPI002E2E24D0|nr:acylneuraminate cytidylyltransferase family protein [Geomesophilobacter sediminis]